MKKNMILFLKGILIGIGKMLPGVSGGMIAIMLHVYQQGLYILAHIKQIKKEQISFLFLIGSGIFLAMILSSNVILSLLSHHYLPTMLLFIGLIIGGIPSIYKNIQKTKKSFFFTLISFSLLLFFSIIASQETNRTISKTFFPLFFIGILDAATMVIPGISGTALLMLLGYYNTIIGSVSKLTNFSSFFLQMPILLPFGLGLFFGFFLFVKLMDYLFYFHKTIVYSIILGFATSSTLLLFLSTLKNNYSVLEIMIGLLLLVIGSLMSYLLDKMN